MSSKKTRKSSRTPRRTIIDDREGVESDVTKPSSPSLTHPKAGKKDNVQNRQFGGKNSSSSQVQPPPGYGDSGSNNQKAVNSCPIPTQNPPIQGILRKYLGDREFSREEMVELVTTLRKEVNNHNNTVRTIEVAQTRLRDIEDNGVTGVINFFDDRDGNIFIQRGGSSISSLKGRVAKTMTFKPSAKGQGNSNQQMLIHLGPQTPVPGSTSNETGDSVPTPPDEGLATSGERKRKRGDDEEGELPDPKVRKVTDGTTPSSVRPEKRKAERVPTIHPSSVLPPGGEKKGSTPSKFSPRSPLMKRSRTVSTPSHLTSPGAVFDDDDDFYGEEEEKVSLTTSVQFWKYVDSFFEPLDSVDKLKELDPSPNNFHSRMSTRIYQQTMSEDYSLAGYTGVARAGAQSRPKKRGKRGGGGRGKKGKKASKKNEVLSPQKQLQQLKLQAQQKRRGLNSSEPFDPLGELPPIGEHYSLRWAREDVANDEMVDGDNIDDSWSSTKLLNPVPAIPSFHPHPFHPFQPGGHQFHSQYPQPYGGHNPHHQSHFGGQGHPLPHPLRAGAQGGFPYPRPGHPPATYGKGGLPHGQEEQIMPYATRSRRRTDDSRSSSSNEFNEKIIEIKNTSKVFEDNTLTMRLMNSLIEERSLPNFSSSMMQNLNPSNYLLLQLQKKNQGGDDGGSSAGGAGSNSGTKRTLTAKRKKLMKDFFFQQLSKTQKELLANVDPKQYQKIQKNLKYSVKEYTAQKFYQFDDVIESTLKDLGVWDVNKHSFRGEEKEKMEDEEEEEEEVGPDGLKRKKKKKKKKVVSELGVDSEKDEDEDDDDDDEFSSIFNDEISLKIQELQQQLKDQYSETNAMKDQIRNRIIGKMGEERKFREKEDEYEMIKKEFERMFNKRKRSNR